ncbi:MAG: cysteine desulfurase family protein [Chloroflexota bacterium]|nr:cysteine desulfurase family protein [Chloroflexota bacterium]
MSAIYLDYNATTPIDPRVVEAMLPYLHGLYGNPSSGHSFGLEARKGVDAARGQVADLLGCQAEDLIFTSGGTEANNHAIKGVALAHRNRGNHIITSSIEHPAVTEVCRYLEGQGFRVTYLPVDETGLVDVGQLERALTGETILVTIMHANNEVGSIQPIAEIAEASHRRGALVHADCAQSVGKIPVKIVDLGVDLLSVAGHKLYAPKGIGALYIRPGVVLEKFMHGASHEQDRRAGTENVIEMVGLGTACQLIEENLSRYASHMREMRDRLESGLMDAPPALRINGHPEERLPNTSSISFKGVEADRVLSSLPTVAASAGAACHSDRVEVSHVLEAMGVPTDYAMGTLRFSTGRFTTRDEIERAVSEVAGEIRSLASTSPAHI